jgi:DNA-binding NarL/FixJ family response regulator
LEPRRARAARRARPFPASAPELILRSNPRRWALDTPPIERLTEEEKLVLELLARGEATKEIAAELAMSPKTVHGRVRDIVVKLGLIRE